MRAIMRISTFDQLKHVLTILIYKTNKIYEANLES